MVVSSKGNARLSMFSVVNLFRKIGVKDSMIKDSIISVSDRFNFFNIRNTIAIDMSPIIKGISITVFTSLRFSLFNIM